MNLGIFDETCSVGHLETISIKLFKIYLDKELSNVYRFSDDGIIYVSYITDKYAAVYCDSKTVYVNPCDIAEDFIIVNKSTQKMYCYLDYQLAGSWDTRTGNDETPTHSGVFNIVEKIADWNFVKYPGSHADYWIAYNTKDEEGIHDLNGDDEDSYGTQAYHKYGSRGCVRTKRNGSKFVYDNYKVGDPVWVQD